MQVYNSMRYLGYDEENNVVIDWKNSGKCVLGVFANIQATCICVVQVFTDNPKWNILEEFILEKQVDCNLSIEKSNYFINKYGIEHAFGNKLGRSICTLRDSFSVSGGYQTYGYEINELSPEQLMFLVQGNLYKINTVPNLQEKWNDEFNSFNLNDVKQTTNLQSNITTYPRIFALASVIHSCTPHTPMSWINEDIPNILINRNTGEIIKDNRLYGQYKSNYF